MEYVLVNAADITHRQNSYVQNINKAMQDMFPQLCTAQSPMTPDIDAQHTNTPQIVIIFTF
jgi:hypothetical protein